MKKLIYVFDGNGFTARTSNYAEALKIREKTGISFSREYKEIEKGNPRKGKYAGKKLAQYTPAYH